MRDYIHVADLAEAHILAVDAARAGEHTIYNLGSGTGFSVQQVISSCERVTGLPISAEHAPRRAGDPAVLIASSARAVEELKWAPQRTDLDRIVADAWDFLRGLGDRSHAAR